MELLACADKAIVVEVEGGSQGRVDVAKEVFHPWGTKSDVV
jgi:hypothetical protein